MKMNSHSFCLWAVQNSSDLLWRAERLIAYFWGNLSSLLLSCSHISIKEPKVPYTLPYKPEKNGLAQVRLSKAELMVRSSLWAKKTKRKISSLLVSSEALQISVLRTSTLGKDCQERFWAWNESRSSHLAKRLLSLWIMLDIVGTSCELMP